MPAYEVSVMHLSSYVAAARAEGVWEKAEPLLSPQTRALLQAPPPGRWVPGRVLQEVAGCIVEAYGAPVLEGLNYRMTRDSLSRIILPFVKVALTITGRNPTAILSRLQVTAHVSMRGVRIDWFQETPNSGQIRVAYPEPPPQFVHVGWWGALRFGFELTERPATLDKVTYEGNALLMNVSWR